MIQLPPSDSNNMPINHDHNIQNQKGVDEIKEQPFTKTIKTLAKKIFSNLKSPADIGKKISATIRKSVSNSSCKIQLVFNNILNKPCLLVEEGRFLKKLGFSNKFILKSVADKTTCEDLNAIMKQLVRNGNSLQKNDIPQFMEKMIVDSGWDTGELKELIVDKGWDKQNIQDITDNNWSKEDVFSTNLDIIIDKKSIASDPKYKMTFAFANMLKDSGWERAPDIPGEYRSSSYAESIQKEKTSKLETPLTVNGKEVKVSKQFNADFKRSMGLFISNPKGEEQLLSIEKDGTVKGFEKFKGLEEAFSKVCPFLSQTVAADLATAQPLTSGHKLFSPAFKPDSSYTKYSITADPSGKGIQSVTIEYVCPAYNMEEGLDKSSETFYKGSVTIHFEGNDYSKGTTEMKLEKLTEAEANTLATDYQSKVPKKKRK